MTVNVDGVCQALGDGRSSTAAAAMPRPPAAPPRSGSEEDLAFQGIRRRTDAALDFFRRAGPSESTAPTLHARHLGAAASHRRAVQALDRQCRQALRARGATGPAEHRGAVDTPGPSGTSRWHGVAPVEPVMTHRSPTRRSRDMRRLARPTTAATRVPAMSPAVPAYARLPVVWRKLRNQRTNRPYRVSSGR